jgi:hypothetical protein
LPCENAGVENIKTQDVTPLSCSRAPLTGHPSPPLPATVLITEVTFFTIEPSPLCRVVENGGLLLINIDYYAISLFHLVATHMHYFCRPNTTKELYFAT